MNKSLHRGDTGRFALQASDLEAALLCLKHITKPFTRFIALFTSFIFICDRCSYLHRSAKVLSVLFVLCQV